MTKRAFFIVSLMAAAFDLVAIMASAQRIDRGVKNYAGGSCVFASAATAARYSGDPRLADWIRTHRWGAESHWHLNRDLNRWGIETRFTERRDKTVLDFAHRRGLPATIAYKQGHSCLFMGWIIDSDGRITHARIWDSNYPNDYEYPTFRRFLSRWYGEAVVMVVKG